MAQPALRIVFRTDGSKKIGFGHLARSSVLADELKNLGYEILFLTSVLDKNIVGFFNAHDMDFMGFSPPTLGKAVYNHLNIMEMFGARTTVLDSYVINADYRIGLKKGGAKIVALDDFYRHYSDADMVINHNPSADKSRYGDFKGEILAGSKYALISNRFARIKRSSNNEKPNILLMMGGSDSLDQTERALKILDSMDEDFRITAIRGFYSGTSKTECIKHPCEVIDKTYDLPSVVARCDAAISACGITAMELSSAGVPFLALSTNHRQLENAHALDKSGVALYGGEIEKLTDDELFESFGKFLSKKDEWEEMGKRGKALVDGHGAFLTAGEVDRINRFNN